MKQFFKLLLTIVLLICALSACSTEPVTTTAPEETTAPKFEAPDFTVYDLEGNAVKLSDFEGKPVVLNFWASWCGPCKNEMPDFNAAYEAQGEKIHFLIVNMTDGVSETVETAHAYVTGQGYTFPVYYDTAREAATTYQVTSIPTTYFIDKDGYLVANAVGMIDAETLQRGIDMIS